ncbi:MAG: hypothetical protein EOP09_19940, partial [Proteobacteria bacterium]
MRIGEFDFKKAFLLFALTSTFSISTHAGDEVETETLTLQQNDSLFGKSSGFGLDLGANDEQNGVLALVIAKLFGKDLSIIEAASKTTNLLDGESE